MSARRRLSRLLLISHVGLVGLLAVLLLATGAGFIHVAVRDQAMVRSAQIASEAQARLAELIEAQSVVAQLLAERPTLQGYLRRGHRRDSVGFLDSFRETAGLDYIRVELGAELFAQVGSAPPLASVAGLQFETEGRHAWLVSQHLMETGRAAARLVVAVRLTSKSLLDPAIGEASVRLIAPATLAVSDPHDTLLLALRHVLATGIAESIAGASGNGAMRIEPIADADGGIAALLVAEISGEVVRRQTFEWLATFVTGSLIVAMFAALLAIWQARRIARPFSNLAEAAERLGLGDLETPVQVQASDLVESVALAQSLESMRRQVRTLAEAERDQRAELSAVLDSVEEGIIAVDDDRRLRYVNRQFLSLVGYTEHEVNDRFCGDVLKPLPISGRRPCVNDCPLLSARRLGAAQATERCTVASGQRNVVIRAAVPNGGRQVAVLREESAEEAARSVRDAILANLSHEFQTPLAAQIASVELLREHLRVSDDLVARRLVNAQYRGALRLSQLVENLLESVRVESGEIIMRRQPVDLRQVIIEAVDLMRPLIEQRDQRIEIDLPEEGCSLMGDPQRLQQVLVNLLANANKFAPDQSTIWIELGLVEGWAILWVEDEGVGLPWQEPRADVFAPFRRAPADEPSQRGTGLGLAIVRSVVERHGGELRIADPQRGRGARLGITLPLNMEAVCAS